MIRKDEIVGNAGSKTLELIKSPESRKRTLRTGGAAFFTLVYWLLFASNLYGQSIRLDSNSRILKEFLVWQKQEKKLEKQVLKAVRKSLWWEKLKCGLCLKSYKLTKVQKEIIRKRRKLKIFLFPAGKYEVLKDGSKVIHILDHDYLFGNLLLDSFDVGEVYNGYQRKICNDSVRYKPKKPLIVNIVQPQLNHFLRPVKINSLRFKICELRTYQFFLDENGYLLDYFKQEELRVQPENNYKYLMELIRDIYKN